MAYQDIGPISKQLTIVVGLTVVGFMAFGLTLSFYRNILFEQQLENIDAQNGQIAQNIENGYQNLKYVLSAQYKDKFAKESLGLINPGEQVLFLSKQHSLLPGNAAQDILYTAATKEAAYFELLRQMPVFEHWKLFLFYPEKLKELR